MADVHDKKTLSYNMSRIRLENTKPELLVRKFLHAKGFRYTLHDKKLPDKQYIVLRNTRLYDSARIQIHNSSRNLGPR